MCRIDEMVVPAVPYRTPKCLVPAKTSADGDGGAPGELVVERFPITFQGYTYRHAHIAYIRGAEPRPVVLVHPNYAGLKQFDIDQAAFLAKCGYVGFALDLYKDIDTYTYSDRNPAPGGLLISDVTGPSAANPANGRYPDKEAFRSESKANRDLVRKHGRGAFDAYMELLRNPKYWRGLMGAYLDLARTHAAVHPTYAAAIGYCFGGQCALDQVRAGHSLQAIVSFHGLLHSRPTYNDNKYESLKRLTQAEFEAEVDLAPNHYAKDCKVLIENGDIDPEVSPESYNEWRAEMDAAGIDWRFNNHAQTPHGFALAPGVWSTAYTEAADRRSTLSMLSLFAEVWPEFPQYPVPTNACGTVLGQAIALPAAKL